MLKYLLLGDETSPAVVLLQDLAEPAVAHDNPVVQQEELPVDLVYSDAGKATPWRLMAMGNARSVSNLS